jgi:peptidyl-prolyl cis-trans isomerase B (cyclophilin B)
VRCIVQTGVGSRARSAEGADAARCCRARRAVSLALSGADGEAAGGPPRARAPTAFRITTGPGPVPSLDGQNIVLGSVLSGMDVIAAIARVPTYAPLSSARSWNALAGGLGDGRAATARAAWSKPRQAVLITAAGLLQDGR